MLTKGWTRSRVHPLHPLGGHCPRTLPAPGQHKPRVLALPVRNALSPLLSLHLPCPTCSPPVPFFKNLSTTYFLGEDASLTHSTRLCPSITSSPAACRKNTAHWPLSNYMRNSWSSNIFFPIVSSDPTDAPRGQDKLRLCPPRPWHPAHHRSAMILLKAFSKQVLPSLNTSLVPGLTLLKLPGTAGNLTRTPAISFPSTIGLIRYDGFNFPKLLCSKYSAQSKCYWLFNYSKWSLGFLTLHSKFFAVQFSPAFSNSSAFLPVRNELLKLSASVLNRPLHSALPSNLRISLCLDFQAKPTPYPLQQAMSHPKWKTSLSAPCNLRALPLDFTWELLSACTRIIHIPYQTLNALMVRPMLPHLPTILRLYHRALEINITSENTAEGHCNHVCGVLILRI